MGDGGSRQGGSERSNRPSWGSALLLAALLLTVPATVWLSDLLERWGSTQISLLVLLALPLVACFAAAAAYALAAMVARRSAYRPAGDEAAEAGHESIIVRTVVAAALIAPFLTLPVAFALATRWEDGRTPAHLGSGGYLYPPMGMRDLFLMGVIPPTVGFLLGMLALPAAHTRRSVGNAKAAIALSVAAGLLVFPTARSAKRSMSTALKAVCVSNIHNVTIALQMYSADNAGTFPPAERWCDVLDEYVKNPEVYLCRESWGTRSSFAYNENLDGARQPRRPRDAASLIAIFESSAGWNAHGGPERLVKEPRHRGGDNWGFADGHVAWVSRKEMAKGAGAKYRWAK
jgi:prepilin-type processing-associated H-X9-DG protein